MLEALAAGALLGLSAGIAPGPLLTLAISETLKHGVRAGIKVALAPLVTDLPIVTLALLFVARLAEIEPALGGISLFGGAFVAYLGVESIRSSGVELAEEQTRPRSLARGVLTNALSPHPYLFWISVGAPTTVRAFEDGHLPAAGSFVLSFYALLIGSKALLAVAAGRSRAFLRGRAYVWANRVLGFLLLAFAMFLVRDGARLLGLLG